MDFTVITPTGDRPIAFNFCKYFMSNQTIKPSQWIIMDDGFVKGDEAKEIPFAEYHRRQRIENHKVNTLNKQIHEALKYVKYDYIFIVEDDDYYASNYFETLLPLFEPDRKLIGNGQSIYYNVSSKKYIFFNNMQHASLCNTAFHSSLIPQIQNICNSNKRTFLDVQIWGIPCSKYIRSNSSPYISIGIKGMPGRRGIGCGHSPYSGNRDTSNVFSTLIRQEDMHIYERFFNDKYCNINKQTRII